MRIPGLITSFFILMISATSVGQKFEDYTQHLENESLNFEMVAVAGGTFIMGAAADDKNRRADEKPPHEVSVDSLWMGKYEINWDQYDAFVFGEFGPEAFKDQDLLKSLGIDAVAGATSPYEDMSNGMGKGKAPAVNMTQYAALMFCKWLTAKTGVFYRLPTEAEWEYVCKTGKTDSSTLEDVAVFQVNADEAYTDTGSKEPNALGIHDMLGNVSEWVLDQYDADYYAVSPTDNPWNTPTELYPRVLRGGSWKDTASKMCCTSRQKSHARWKRRDPQIPKSNWWHTNADFVGFRLVRPFAQPSPKEIANYWLEAMEDYGLN
jgi:formylglycine-generating enzyme required for sulfatase activity